MDAGVKNATSPLYACKTVLERPRRCGRIFERNVGTVCHLFSATDGSRRAGRLLPLHYRLSGNLLWNDKLLAYLNFVRVFKLSAIGFKDLHVLIGISVELFADLR